MASFRRSHVGSRWPGPLSVLRPVANNSTRGERMIRVRIHRCISDNCKTFDGASLFVRFFFWGYGMWWGEVRWGEDEKHKLEVEDRRVDVTDTQKKIHTQIGSWIFGNVAQLEHVELRWGKILDSGSTAGKYSLSGNTPLRGTAKCSSFFCTTLFFTWDRLTYHMITTDLL